MTNKSVNKNIGVTIKNNRKKIKWTQQKLGDYLKIHQSAVCRVESGSQALTPWQLRHLSELFKLDVNDFYE